MYISQLEQTLTSFAIGHRDTLIGPLTNRRFSTMIIGGAGIGKTESVLNIGTNLDMAVVITHVSQLEPGELLGIPRSVEVRPGVTVQRYDLPGYLPHYKLDESGEIETKVFEDGIVRKVIDVLLLGSKVKNRRQLQEKHGFNWHEKVKGVILFLDEINRAVGDDTKQAIFELPGDYALHEYEVPESCIIIAAGNPSTSDYQVNEMDEEKAWMDRFIGLKVEGRLNDSIRYFQKKEYDPAILSFITSDEDALMEPEESFDLNVKRTPRSYKALDTLLKYIDLPDRDSVRQEIFMGVLGTEYGMSFSNHLKHNLETVPSGKTVLMNYESVRPLVQEALAENRFSYTDRIVRHVQVLFEDESLMKSLSWIAATEEDVVRIKSSINTEVAIGDSIPNPAHVKNIVNFLSDLPSEIRMSLITQTIDFEWVNEFLGPEDIIYNTMENDSKDAFDDNWKLEE